MSWVWVLRVLEVVVRRAWSLYAGFPLGLILAFLVAAMSICTPCGPLDPVLGFASIAAGILVHEAVHYLAGLVAGVEGLRIRLLPRLTAIIVEYDAIRPWQYVVMTLAPQLLSVAIISYAVLSQCMGPELCLFLVVNLAGGGPDVALAIYFGARHGGAEYYRLLYGEDGGIVGGVVEYRDRLVVYVF